MPGLAKRNGDSVTHGRACPTDGAPVSAAPSSSPHTARTMVSREVGPRVGYVVNYCVTRGFRKHVERIPSDVRAAYNLSDGFFPLFFFFAGVHNNNNTHVLHTDVPCTVYPSVFTANYTAGTWRSRRVEGRASAK